MANLVVSQAVNQLGRDGANWLAGFMASHDPKWMVSAWRETMALPVARARLPAQQWLASCHGNTMAAKRRSRTERSCSMGSWEILEENSEVAAVHAALLPTGDVVYYSGNTGQDIPAATRIWSPNTRLVREPPTAPETDVFCSGLTPLWDGRLFVVGGTLLYPTDTNPFIGSKATYGLNPETGWERLEDMVFGRWYPSAIML